MTSSPTVLVLGAGFTRAFLPKAPLMLDDYGAPELAAKLSAFPRACRLLGLEIALHSNGHINIESLMTRLDGLMPYDRSLSAEQEYAQSMVWPGPDRHSPTGVGRNSRHSSRRPR